MVGLHNHRACRRVIKQAIPLLCFILRHAVPRKQDRQKPEPGNAQLCQADHLGNSGAQTEIAARKNADAMRQNLRQLPHGAVAFQQEAGKRLPHKIKFRHHAKATDSRPRVQTDHRFACVPGRSDPFAHHRKQMAVPIGQQIHTDTSKKMGLPQML